MAGCCNGDAEICGHGRQQRRDHEAFCADCERAERQREDGCIGKRHRYPRCVDGDLPCHRERPPPPMTSSPIETLHRCPSKWSVPGRVEASSGSQQLRLRCPQWFDYLARSCPKALSQFSSCSFLTIFPPLLSWL